VLLASAAGACDDAGPEARFRARVVPILERRCATAACHGVAPGAEAGDVIDRRFFFVDIDAAGRIADPAAAYANVKARINTVERAEFSSLLRKPLALAVGGVPHAGGHAFTTRDDPDWITLRDWIADEDGGGEGAPRASLDERQRRFADTVLPVLRGRGCMVARCHGPQGFAGLPLVPPMDGMDGEPSVAEILASYESARANLSLVGDPRRSRLLVKALPLDAGGIAHRGGNDTFFPHVGSRDPREDPGAQAILAWARAERLAAAGAEAAAPVGVVFVRGPAAPRALLDLAAFRPGSDVWFHPGLEPGATPINLTAAAHPEGPADVRDPAPSHDGTRVYFSMRRDAADAHNLYVVGLGGGGLTQLTFDAAPVVNRWPLEGPDGRVYFASTRAGSLDESMRAPDSELYALDPAAPGAPVRLTFTPTPELAPSWLATGEFRGSLAFTTVRRRDGLTRGAVFRFPPDHDRAAHLQPEYHPHHGQTAPADVVWSLRELPDGRDLAVLVDEGNVWEGGALALVERQFGPDLPAGAPAAVPGFRHAVSLLDEGVAAGGASPGGLYRDPAALPDGGVLVAWAPGPLDLDDPAATPDTAIWRLVLEPTADGARLATRTVLVDAPGLADDQPQPVYARGPEDDAHPWGWTPDGAGFLRHSGVAVNEAVNRVLFPSGAKPLRGDAVLGRLVAFLPLPPGAGPAVDPALVANGDPASTWWSNGIHAPVAWLADVPLEADGSFWAELPAGLALRLVLVDADGFAAGRQSALWIHVQGGETFPQGAPPAAYGRLCAGCHGALDGDPAHALPPVDAPDAITEASRTLSAFEARNPRRPRAPLPLGDARPRGFDFGRDLAPSLERSCALAGCHAGTAPAGGLSLVPTPTTYYDAAYEALQAFGPGSTGGKKYVDERNASAWGSYLIEKITGRELGAPRALGVPCPPPGSGAPPLDADVVRAFIRWVDLGAFYRTPEISP
jgi:hypothetical protein